jgi:hypothetical protein
MKHITWLLVVLALGCGRDRKAWARKITDLVIRAEECQDVTCAEQVDREMGKIIGSDEGRNLEEGEVAHMLSARREIQRRLAELKIATAPKVLSRPEVFDAAIQMCDLAFDPARPKDQRDRVSTLFAKVGATPPDAPTGTTNGDAVGWMNAASRTFMSAAKKKLVLEDAVLYILGHDLCVTSRLYNREDANLYATMAKEIDEATRLTGLARGETTEVTQGLRAGAASEEVRRAASKAIDVIAASTSLRAN